MIELEIIKFHPSHLWLCDGLVTKPAYLRAITDRWDNDAFIMKSVFKEGKMIALYGIKFIYPGCGEAFAMFTKDKKKLAKSLVLACKRLLQVCDSEWGIHRLQAPIPVSNKVEIRFASIFGFKEEGVLKSYCPETKQDCVMLGRIN